MDSIAGAINTVAFHKFVYGAWYVKVALSQKSNGWICHILKHTNLLFSWT